MDITGATEAIMHLFPGKELDSITESAVEDILQELYNDVYEEAFSDGYDQGYEDGGTGSSFES